MTRNQDNVIEKVTAFIVRGQTSEVSKPAALGGQTSEVLLIKHPFAGIQLPAGTVEIGERAEEAVIRESAEETGLTTCVIVKKLGVEETVLPADQRIIMSKAPVYARPAATSFDWAHIRRGIRVNLTGNKQAGFTQISYTENDQLLDPNYITFQITGWVQNDVLANVRHRHFFLLHFAGTTPTEWQCNTDNHTFTLFWAPISNLPPLVAPQASWRHWLTQHSRAT
jgi:8-oxo-dGTP pyrophosphatase MutT (NUDIX family)